MRNYSMMRSVLSVVAESGRQVNFDDFRVLQPRDSIVDELIRLSGDGLISGNVEFDGRVCEKCDIDGLTAEGEEFYRLIENQRVWGIVLATLKRANVDVSYPLLKDVCEEIVKRYVTSFIPEIGK